LAVPANPSVASRAVYFPFAPPASVALSTGQLGSANYPQAIAAGGFTQQVAASVVAPDIPSANPGVALPATVLSVNGAAPDYSGMTLLVHCPDGSVVRRYAGFAANQPMAERDLRWEGDFETEGHASASISAQRLCNGLLPLVTHVA
jgi:hypothetical protein